MGEEFEGGIGRNVQISAWDSFYPCKELKGWMLFREKYGESHFRKAEPVKLIEHFTVDLGPAGHKDIYGWQRR